MADWEELSGKKKWDGLLKPLNKNLSKTIIHYGKRVQAIYDTIEDDKKSPRYGLPKYEEKEFFSKVGLGMYTMSKYLYARADNSRSAWIGYVAVATDEGKRALGRRDIMICWRGTLTPAEWIKDLQSTQTSASEIFGWRPGNPRVHEGFLSIYMTARQQVLKAVKELMNEYEHEKISITVAGHCMGAALGALNVADIVANGYNKSKDCECMPECMVTAFAFSSPMVGDIVFKIMFEKLSNLHLLNIKHVRDPVPKLPPGGNYFTVGIQLDIYATYSASMDSLPLVLSGSDILFKYHHLKNLLKAVEAQEDRCSQNLESNLVVEQLENGYWKLYVPTLQTQAA